MDDFLKKYGRSLVIIGVSLLLIGVMFWLSPNRESETASVSNDAIVKSSKPTDSGKSAGHRKIGGSSFSQKANEVSAKDAELAARSKALLYSPNPSIKADNPEKILIKEALIEKAKQMGNSSLVEIWQDSIKDYRAELAQLEKLPANLVAMKNIQTDLGNKNVRRQSKAFEAARSEINSQEDLDDFYREQPASYNTKRELAARKALRGLQLSLEPYDLTEDGGPISYTQEPEEWRTVANYLREERDFASAKLSEGDSENPHWWADHLEWIEETAEAMEIPLDAENEDWIDAHVSAAKQRQWARDDERNRKQDEEAKQILQPAFEEGGFDYAEFEAIAKEMKENPSYRPRRRMPPIVFPIPPEVLLRDGDLKNKLEE